MLPTLRAFGRAEIRATCPNGHRVPKSLGMVRDLHIPLAGGPSSGKSSLAAGAFVELATVGREAGLGVELAGEDARKFARVIRGLATGTEPAKTIQQRQPALLARLRRPGRKRDVFLFAYDVAGELYADADRVRAAQSLDYISGAVLVVDPGSVPALAREKRAEIAAQAGLKVSTEEPADVYSRLVNALRERGVDIGRLRLAVVLTKVDALDVREDLERIDDGVEALATAPARAWLELHGQDALVGRAEQDFKEVGFFAASALGRSPDASGLPFEPQGALEPIRWIMSRNGFQIPQLQGPVDEEVDLGVSQDFAGGTVHRTRSRGAWHTRARDRAPRPAVELSRINVLAHLPYAVVL
ncbi:MAG: TRAFAC clade GTPase domain-containing protein, partial [Solirubrobacteraceae bacterium]